NSSNKPSEGGGRAGTRSAFLRPLLLRAPNLNTALASDNGFRAIGKAAADTNKDEDDEDSEDRVLLEELLRQLVSNERLIARLVRNDAFLDRMAADPALLAELGRRQVLLAQLASLGDAAVV
ncbi:hypothetical protein Agub_g3759, partial [Astrephomene gubernaculifera]